MRTLSEPELTAPSPPGIADTARPAAGLIVATIRTDAAPADAATTVGELDAATLRRIRQDALALRARHARPVVIEARFVASPEALRLVATLADLEAHGIRVVPCPIAALGSAAPLPPRSPMPVPGSPDPFGIDPAFRRSWLAPLRLVFEHYWRVEVSGCEHLDDVGPALVAANHAGALPADAFMLAVALEMRRPPRALRVLYDRFVDALPVVGPLYRRLGAVSASFANAELLLERGELVGLFPEGIAGVEKRCTERYRLRPFKSGAARLAVRTGAPIVPVAIVGAEEAYPVIARLYRVGRVVGVPWIPITPTFPLCGLAGAVPLPTKWHIRFGAPIWAPPADGRPEETRVAETTASLRDAIAAGVADLLAKRRGIFV